MKHTIAIIGCGRIARDAHFPALTKLDNVHIKYACDLIFEKAQDLVEKFGIDAQIITDYNIALNDPEVDTVWVLTPNFAHYTVTMDALRAGKNVMCEKPITVNYELSCEMAAEAEKQGKMLNIGVCNRYHRSVEILEKMVRDGKFGNIYHVVCSFRSFRSIPGLGGAFTTKSQSGGGVLIDWGIHFLDLILYVIGNAKLKTVSCDTYSEMAKDMKSYVYKSMWAEDTKDIENGTNDVDDYVTGYVRTDKASISVNGAWAQNVEQNDMWIDFLGNRGGARLNYGGQFKFTDGSTLETTASEHDIPDMYLCEDEDFLRSIDSGVKNRNNIENIIESMKLLDALYKSAEEGREIAL
ncbi:MAG: Gfo/Idh/MocA family oxidoreductase [Ruminococcaceae bacterium]|nr:Gfo/Idh/MocA family oxidoreductase [Oscillospiraceae bacterium]